MAAALPLDVRAEVQNGGWNCECQKNFCHSPAWYKNNFKLNKSEQIETGAKDNCERLALQISGKDVVLFGYKNIKTCNLSNGQHVVHLRRNTNICSGESRAI